MSDGGYTLSGRAWCLTSPVAVKCLKGAGVCFDEVLGMDRCLQIGVSLWYLGDA